MTRSRLRSTFTSCTPLIFIRVGRSLRTHSSQSSPSVAISIVSKIAWSAGSGKKGSAGSGSFGRAGSIVFLYLTCENRAAAASAYLSYTWLQPGVIRASVISRLRLADVPRGTKPLKRLACCRPDEHRVENPVLMRLAGNLTSNRFEHAPDVFGKDFLPGRVWMNAVR